MLVDGATAISTSRRHIYMPHDLGISKMSSSGLPKGNERHFQWSICVWECVHWHAGMFVHACTCKAYLSSNFMHYKSRACIRTTVSSYLLLYQPSMSTLPRIQVSCAVHACPRAGICKCFLHFGYTHACMAPHMHCSYIRFCMLFRLLSFIYTSSFLNWSSLLLSDFFVSWRYAFTDFSRP